MFARNRLLSTLIALSALTLLAASPAQAYREAPSLDAEVKAGTLPPVDQRLPAIPRIVTVENVGAYGGDLRIGMSRARDTRMMTVYGYARLVGYDQDYNLVPDILEAFESIDDKVFTLTLREGHKWSDGHPFTTEDFRYWWEDVANNEKLAPLGPPVLMKVDGEVARVEIIDERTIRYSWSKPNPFFLPAMAGPRPPFIYRPAHYMRQFHAAYADAEKLEAEVAAQKMRGWAALHNSRDNLYNFDNPELPTLQPWRNTIRPPAQQFVFVRNPYFHRVDPAGNQLPYIDRVLMNISDAKLIPAKAAAGELDLQARNLFMSHYTFLKQGEKTEDFKMRLWETAQGAKVALFPNLHVNDPVWREVFRNRDFRHAMSVAIDREEINEVVYYGLAEPSNNTVVPRSPLFAEELQTLWTQHDPDLANTLLDGMGLDKRDRDGIRFLPDGRRMEIVVETAGEETEQTDVLELVHDAWFEVGVKIFTRPSQREVFRNRIFSGETQMSIAAGVNNGIANADMSPAEFAPTDQVQYQWPKWGQHYQTDGKAGEAIDLPTAQELFALFREWQTATTRAQRTEIWKRVLEINAEETFSIGIVCCTKQPVVVSDFLKNVPEKAVYAWNPGAHFGVYLPDTFYFGSATKP
ncbi:MAG: ABC transporter substrate-binding protein [Alphaproteobacteria bacterium]